MERDPNQPDDAAAAIERENDEAESGEVLPAVEPDEDRDHEAGE